MLYLTISSIKGLTTFSNVLASVKQRLENKDITADPPIILHPTGPENNVTIPPIKPKEFEVVFTTNYPFPICPLEK